MQLPDDLRKWSSLAARVLPKAVHDYYAGGAGEELTSEWNEKSWQDVLIHYRVLQDVSKRTLSTTVLGQSVSLPILLAPTAFHQLAHPEGEVASARGARAADTVMILSTLSTLSIEAVCAEAPGQIWFQLYVYKDRGVTRELLQRAEAAGARAIVLTVDAPVLGRRQRDIDNQFTLPPGLRLRNLTGTGGNDELPRVEGGSGLQSLFAEQLDPSLNWKDLEWFKAQTSLPLVLKGLVRPDDARRAVDAGASAVVVSNHGGRQLDGSPPTARVLASVVEAVDGRLEVLVDGGIRRGTDVLKALALGARAVLIGRPALWGLALQGTEGVVRVLDTLRTQLDQALALSGCPSVEGLPDDLVSYR